MSSRFSRLHSTFTFLSIVLFLALNSTPVASNTKITPSTKPRTSHYISKQHLAKNQDAFSPKKEHFGSNFEDDGQNEANDGEFGSEISDLDFRLLKNSGNDGKNDGIDGKIDSKLLAKKKLDEMKGFVEQISQQKGNNDQNLGEKSNDNDEKSSGKLRGSKDEVGLDGLEESTSFIDGLSSSFAMILVSELGDETFIIAAIMAMRQNRAVVLAGALGALYVMTILSTALGYVVPNLINKQVAANLATGLYIFFGLRLFYIAYYANEEEGNDEIDEVEEKLKETKRRPGSRCASLGFLSGICTPLFLEVFILTFSAEWGDRSQIATIALAAHKNPYAVTLGACAGHTICTSIAVWGGRLAASKISQRTVAICGGITFFIFALWNVLVGFHE